jgi:hypothetical protein
VTKEFVHDAFVFRLGNFVVAGLLYL